jgi:hypothetical protein
LVHLCLEVIEEAGAHQVRPSEGELMVEVAIRPPVATLSTFAVRIPVKNIDSSTDGMNTFDVEMFVIGSDAC